MTPCGAESVLSDVLMEMLDETRSFGETSIEDLNHLAEAMRTHNVIDSLDKYKAVLCAEYCEDVIEAAERASLLNEYEFYQSETLEEIVDRFRDQYDPEWDDTEIAEDMGLEETCYGVLRRTGGPALEHSMDLS